MKEVEPICAKHNCGMDIKNHNEYGYDLYCRGGGHSESVTDIVCPSCQSILYICKTFLGDELNFCSNPNCSLYENQIRYDKVIDIIWNKEFVGVFIIYSESDIDLVTDYLHSEIEKFFKQVIKSVNERNKT